MSNFKEIVTKAVLGKGKKNFVTEHVITPEFKPSTILGCWVINHNFKGEKNNDQININGSYDVNIWYSYDNDTKTQVIKQTNTYQETVRVKKNDDSDSNNEDVIIRSLSQPTCSKVEIVGDSIKYTIEKELGIELVGDTKVRISVDDNEEAWDNIIEEQDTVDKIDNEVKEDSIDINEDAFKDINTDQI